MNRENALLYLPLIQALADGKIIQYKHKRDSWMDLEDHVIIGFYDKPQNYRIKPEPRTFERYLNKETGTMITVNLYKANNYDERYFDDFERITVQEVLE
jgi:hypothetical protein